jgi:RNA polymerase sigma-70 factor (ECF subfamily)
VPVNTEATPSWPTKRTNEEWIAALTSEAAQRAASERDLRAILVDGLRRALSQRVDDDLCQDFAQEAMMRVCAHIADFRGESRFTSWAIAIAVRVAFDELRHQRWKDVSFDALTQDADHLCGPGRCGPRSGHFA